MMNMVMVITVMMTLKRGRRRRAEKDVRYEACKKE
jgi:hypothetical protein